MAKLKCPHCDKPFVRFPIKDENGNIIVRNLFKTDMISIFFVIAIIAVTIGYKADMAKCDAAINEPCEFCFSTGCCKLPYVMLQEVDINSTPTLDNQQLSIP